jgi:hypothetical protein
VELSSDGDEEKAVTVNASWAQNKNNRRLFILQIGLEAFGTSLAAWLSLMQYEPKLQQKFIAAFDGAHGFISIADPIHQDGIWIDEVYPYKMPLIHVHRSLRCDSKVLLDPVVPVVAAFCGRVHITRIV